MTADTSQAARTTVFSVGDLTGLTYTRDFVSAEQHNLLLERIYSSKQAWERVSGRRLQRHGGAVLGNVLVPAPLPSWLQPWVAQIQGHCQAMGVDRRCGLDWQPNHVLINAYKPGQGIMPHQDGPAYAPLVAILSLGAPCVLRFYPHRRENGSEVDVFATAPAQGPPRPTASLVLEPGSLVTFADTAFHAFLHGIDAVHADTLDATVCNTSACGLHHGGTLPRCQERVSLTVRHVLRTRPILFGTRRRSVPPCKEPPSFLYPDLNAVAGPAVLMPRSSAQSPCL